VYRHRKFLLLSLFLLASCSVLPWGRNKNEIVYSPKATMVAKWSYSLGENESGLFMPQSHSNFIYAAGGDRQVAKIASESGKASWRVKLKLKKDMFSAGVGVGSNLVLVGTKEGAVIALDADGKERWRTTLTSSVQSLPQVFGNIVVVRSADSRVFALDARTGKNIWVYERELPPLVLAANPLVAFNNGMIYAGMPGGILSALELQTGRVLWEQTITIPRGASDIDRVADVSSQPLVEGDAVYVAAYQGRVAKLRADDGAVLWARDISSYAGMDSTGDRIFVSAADGTLYGLDKTTGETLWVTDILLGRALTKPLYFGGYVIVGDDTGHVNLFDPLKGTLVGRRPLDKTPLRTAPVTDQKNILIQTQGGRVYCLETKPL
jgi:outer membrane protein assembly factor BamB